MDQRLEKFPTPYLIVGMAKSGLAIQSLLLKLGVQPESIRTYDDVPSKGDFSSPDQLNNFSPGTLFVAPGYPLAKPWIQNLLQTNAVLASEIDLASSCLENETLIGVTGSVGKSTTVSLLGAALINIDPNVFVGGNIGTPFCQYILDVIGKTRARAKYIVLELSSFQLENAKSLKLDFSAITYFSGNHLERYKNIDEYFQTKWNILLLTRQSCFLNGLSDQLVSWSSHHPDSRAVCVKNNSIDFSRAKLVGNHNLENLNLAYSLLAALGLSQEGLSGLLGFGGLPHRLETVVESENIVCINDSKATAVESVVTAISATKGKYTDSKITVLVGGKDKNLPWKNLRETPFSSHISFVFFGECGALAQNESGLSGLRFSTLKAALDSLAPLFSASSEKNVILLSPGGSSFDEFKGFEDRGEFFSSFCRSAIKSHAN